MKERTEEEDEEKRSAAQDDGEGVIDFRAEVEITRAGKVPIDSKIRQLTLRKESVLRMEASGDSKRFSSSHASDSCSDCEQEI